MEPRENKSHPLEQAHMQEQALVTRRDRIVVSTLRCGRSNPGSNPGHGSGHILSTRHIYILDPILPRSILWWGYSSVVEQSAAVR